MRECEKTSGKNFFQGVTIMMTMLLMLFILYGVKLGLLQDKQILVDYMKTFGIGAPLFFIFLQMVQVVFPVIPGGASCFSGVLAFGPVLGFVYNYVGLVLGSLVAFSLSRRYGLKLVRTFFKEETIDKYLGYIRTSKFLKIFFWGILLPGLPDDLLCYIAGISSMKYKSFLVIILIAKPLALLMYSAFIVLL